MKKPAEAPHFALSQYFLVDSIEETLGKVEAGGGPRSERGPFSHVCSGAHPRGCQLRCQLPLEPEHAARYHCQ